MKEKNSENSQNSKQVLRRLAKFPKEIAGEILGILKPFTINQNIPLSSFKDFS